MSEPTIVAALQTLFPNKVFAWTVPADTARPFCIYQHVGGRPSNTLCGDTNQQNTRLQFWIWCDPPPAGGGATQAATLMRQLAAIVTEAPLRGVSQGGLVATFDHTTRSFGAQQDFSFWF